MDPQDRPTTGAGLRLALTETERAHRLPANTGALFCATEYRAGERRNGRGRAVELGCMRFLIAPLLLAVLAAGCSSVVTGAGTAEPAPPTTAVVATTTTVEPEPTATPPPAAIDESAPAQYCDRPFTGALGEEMLAVVVETPAGRLTCDQAAAILVDYYAQRSDPKTGLPPLAVGPMSCNQVPEGSMPQVVCSDGDNLIYSMWEQR